jgi:bifunctional DNA-binding transcriptional regulator/antitoxin component of YhaV-PrlF toxin-antitoxin module
MLRPENATRKIDSLGRVTLPKGMRDRMFIADTDELEFFTMMADGREYICMAKVSSVDPKYLAARSVLEEMGVEIPEKLEAACNGGE